MTKKVQEAAEYLFNKFKDIETLFNVGNDLFFTDRKGSANANAAAVQLNFKEMNTGRNLKKVITIKRSEMPKKVAKKTKK